MTTGATIIAFHAARLGRPRRNDTWRAGGQYPRTFHGLHGYGPQGYTLRDAGFQDRDHGDRWPMGLMLVSACGLSLGLWAMIISAIYWIV